MYKENGEVLSKLRLRGFRETSLSTHDFKPLYCIISNISRLQLEAAAVDNEASDRKCVHRLICSNVYFQVPLYNYTTRTYQKIYQ